jgi:hypothetical protein
MTGRDLIIYILQNNLEDEPVIKDDKLLGFITVQEAALKFGVGPATITLWCKFNVIPYFAIGDNIYIPANIVKGDEKK